MVNPVPATSPAPSLGITPGQIIAFSRNIAAALAGLSALLVGVLHFLSQDQVNALVSAIQNIGTAVAAIVTAISVVIPIITGLFAARAAGPVNQAQSLLDSGHADKILASEDLAAASTSPNVIPTAMYEPKA